MLPENGRCTGAYYTIPVNHTAVIVSAGAGTDETLDMHFVLNFRYYNQSWIQYGDVWLRGEVWYYEYPNIVKVPEKTDMYISAQSGGNDNGHAWITLYEYDNNDKPETKMTGTILPDANMMQLFLLLLLVIMQLANLMRYKIR